MVCIFKGRGTPQRLEWTNDRHITDSKATHVLIIYTCLYKKRKTLLKEWNGVGKVCRSSSTTKINRIYEYFIIKHDDSRISLTFIVLTYHERLFKSELTFHLFWLNLASIQK